MNPGQEAAGTSQEPGAARGAPRTARTRIFSARILRVGQHLITAVLLVFAVLRSLSSAHSPTWLVLLAGVLFAAWYLAGLRWISSPGPSRLPAAWLGVLLVLWGASLLVSVEFMWLSFSLWLLIGHLLSFGSSVLWSLVVYAMTIVAPFLHHGQTSYASVIGPLVGGTFAWGISRGYLQLLRDGQERDELVASLMQAHQEMAALHEELARSQHEAGVLAERTRLARDIHDTVAQQLSSISLHATAALSSADPGAATNTLDRIQLLSAEALADLRRIIAALAPAELDDQALAGALARMLERLAAETGIDVQLRADASLPALDTTVQVALLRIAQSALANVRRHANASKVVVSLQDLGDTVRLDIFDDGIGFDIQDWQHGAGRDRADGGFGLASMRQRLRELGGGLDLESTLGDGTGLSAYLPLGHHKGN